MRIRKNSSQPLGTPSLDDIMSQSELTTHDLKKMSSILFSVEQFGSGPFNRAMLMNVGAAEALKQVNTLSFETG